MLFRWHKEATPAYDYFRMAILLMLRIFAGRIAFRGVFQNYHTGTTRLKIYDDAGIRAITCAKGYHYRVRRRSPIFKVTSDFI